MKRFCPALLVWFLSLSGVNESVRPQVESTTVSQVEAIPSDEGESAQLAKRAESGLYFPDYVDGGGWSVQLALSNVARRVPAAVAVTAYDQDGHPHPELFDSETAFEVPPLGSRVLRSVGTEEVRRGWIEVRSNPPAVSGLLTYRHSGSGVEVGVAPVPLGDRFALFVEESSEIGTGLALFKPEADSEVEFRLRDKAGSDPFGQDLTLGDFRQQARTLPEWFNPIGAAFPGDFRGLLFLRTGEDSSFAPLGLRFGKRKTSLSAVPGIRFLGEGGGGAPNPFQPTTSTASPLYFPDYVDGAGWSVQLVLGNLDPDRSVPVEVEVYDQQGRSLDGLFDSETRFELPAQGSRVLRSAGGTRIRRGWIKIQADSTSVRGLLVYRHGETGIEVGVAPVAPREEFVLFVEESSEIGTGLALFKPQVNTKVEFRIRDEAGNDPLGNVYVPWRNFRQSARTLSEWLDVDGVETGFLKNFRGLLFLRTEDGSEFAPLGLRYGKGTSALSAVPGIGIVDGVRIDTGVGSDGGVEIDGGVGIDGGGMAPPPTVTLSVSPSSIDRGQSATLRWSSTNAESVEITPDVGKVSTSGTQMVSPRSTTSYRITVTAADGRTATATVTVTVAITERAVLEAFYEATDGPNWTYNDNWLTDAPLGDWYGVDTDNAGRVTTLDLSGRFVADEYVSVGLKGSIPSELGMLARLSVLHLSGNYLTGPIPRELGTLNNLVSIDIRWNELSGPIPPELGRLTNLRSLKMYANRLTGEIPPELGDLTNLRSLDLYGNRLIGEIPPELGDLINLNVLLIGGSDLSGFIPRELSRLTNLTILDISQTNISGSIPAALGNLRSLITLKLSRSDLSGSIPPELGSLTNLEILALEANKFTGPLPRSLLDLAKLRRFWFERNKGVCAPGTDAFVDWLEAMEEFQGSYCNESDRTALESLYEATGGAGWTNSDGWTEGPALAEWFGVIADSLGRVATLDLTSNGLSGRLPANLGVLTSMTELHVANNADLSGRLPLGLKGVPLRSFHYSGTDLCASEDASFQNWLNTLQSHEGTGTACPPISTREILRALYETTGGANWANSNNWLTDAPLQEWHGVQVTGEDEIYNIDLFRNNLSGVLPPELGSLTGLRSLSFFGNNLTGSIPPDIGNLTSLRLLDLGGNSFTGPLPPELGSLINLDELVIQSNEFIGPLPSELGGMERLRNLYAFDAGDFASPIPPEFGDLVSLEKLSLGSNSLQGEIPQQLGRLSNLRYLFLDDNKLSGSIPAELGNLHLLEEFWLGDNKLSGPIPREIGNLSSLQTWYLESNDLEGPVPSGVNGMMALRELGLSYNPRLSGTLPPTLTALRNLDVFVALDTNLCAPSDDDFRAWTESVANWRVLPCEPREPSAAYLVQAVQSREWPVPLVAGEEALLRVFVTAGRDNTAPIPPVRASFYSHGGLVYETVIPGKVGPIRTTADESSLAYSANTVVPAEIIQPGLELVVDIDPDGTLDPDLGVARRVPETGRLAIDVKDMPVFDLTLLPFLWTADPDSAILESVAETAADPEYWLWRDATYLPVGSSDVKVHEPIMSSSNNPWRLLAETQLARTMEGGTGYWMGTMSGTVDGPAGIAPIGKKSLFCLIPGPTAHELGHSFGLYHAPCGGAGGPDKVYPYEGGTIGAWGYDWRDGGRLVPPGTPDLMTYCGGWISDYHYTKALRYRFKYDVEDSATSASTSLLVWGGLHEDAEPFLEPAFVVDAPRALPDSVGDHEITGLSNSGSVLFTLRFSMPKSPDGDGRSSFAFAIPVRPGWAGNLASITLSGPGGSAVLNTESDQPVAILRNPRTGQVRAILRDAPPSATVAGYATGRAVAPDMEVLFSRGIPDPEAWRR